MTDYLSSGGIKSPDILYTQPGAGARRNAAPQSKDELYLEGYGRQFGEKLTYSVGVTYGAGLAMGGFYGTLLGLRKGGATTKLLVNSVMNSAGRYGPVLANQNGIITMYYVGFSQLIGWARGADDLGNAVSAGALSGALYKVAAKSWEPKLKYAAAAGAFFTAIDLAFRNNLL
eukprot:TRINITY_DN8858_c0_g1_i1.p2 TRINITY_DN8858_c0_g1~~TRINITY_DN8858_c0_g1_i1.p2  ORF type:complete len:173 (+),score=43.43 TRINITY_DN8858_c0_g1_i1:86-604(+)